MNKKTQKIIVGISFYNEAQKLPGLFKNLKKIIQNKNFFFFFIDDHSTDSTSRLLKKFVGNAKNMRLITNKKNLGIGKSIKTVISYGIKNSFDICVIMAGNGKDNPIEINNLIKPLLQNNYDYVQGSRFLKGGSFNNLPFIRKKLINTFTLIFYLFTGIRSTDASNGFRAYKLALFKDKRININQAWLDRYEFETYLHYKVITLGYNICEIPVSKNYLSGVKDYSKIRPVIDWWRMLRPVIFLKFGLKK